MQQQIQKKKTNPLNQYKPPPNNEEQAIKNTWRDVDSIKPNNNNSNNNNNNNNFKSINSLEKLGNRKKSTQQQEPIINSFHSPNIHDNRNPFNGQSTNNIVNIVQNAISKNSLNNYVNYMKQYKGSNKNKAITNQINGDVSELELYKKYIQNLNKSNFSKQDIDNLNNITNKINNTIKNMKNILKHKNKLNIK